MNLLFCKLTITQTWPKFHGPHVWAPCRAVSVLSDFPLKSLLLTYLFMWHYNQYLVKACSRRSFHKCLFWAQCVQYLTLRARLSLFTPTAHLDFCLPWYPSNGFGSECSFFMVGLRVFWSCDQRSAICLSSWHLGHSGC
jgi:hypothetical protein